MFRPLPLIVAALSFPALFLAQPANAIQDGQRAVAVSGLGTAKARPDMARISTGVVSEGESAQAALDKNTAAMGRVTAALKDQGVDEADIQTTNFSVHPKFEHFKDNTPPAIVGYRVVNSVRITVRDLDKLGAILDQVVELGSNQIGGIEFAVADAAPLEQTARRRAMENARAKAELYAGEAGAELGQVLSITEDFPGEPPQQPQFRAAQQAQSAPVPIQPGEHQVQVRIHVTWALK